jgi:hypothetical protein
MSRRSDPARIGNAHREAMRQRLLSTGMLPERVATLIAAWDAEAVRRELPPGDRMDGAWDRLQAQRK